MIETVFLVVLIISLAIGNLLLSFIPTPKGSSGGNKEVLVLDSGEPPQNFVSPGTGSDVALSNISALNSKINLLAQQMDGISQKVRKFDHFRANSAIELTAIREILTELQHKYITVPARQKKSGEGLSAKEMHKIIYRSK